MQKELHSFYFKFDFSLFILNHRVYNTLALISGKKEKKKKRKDNDHIRDD